MTGAPLLRRTGRDRTGRPWLIRPAVENDARDLVSLRDSVAAEGTLLAATPGERSSLEEALALATLIREGSLAIVVETAGELVGQLQVARRRGRYEGHVGDLSIALAAGSRRQGLGTALMTVAVEWASAVRLRKLCLAVFPENHAAVALYGRCGFQPEGTQRGQVNAGGADRDILLMGLALPERGASGGLHGSLASGG